MRHPLFTLLLAGIALGFSALGSAQENGSGDSESAARSILADERFQNLLRSAKNDPEGTAQSLQNDPEAAVREATRLFQDNREKINEATGLDTPENRAKAESIANAAMSKVNEIKGGSSEVPATRSAADATRFIKPIAMPTEESAKPLATDKSPETIVQSTAVEPIPTAQPTVPRIPDMAGLDKGDIPAPAPLQPKYKTETPDGNSAKLGADKNHMRIRARESEMDNNRGIITFLGNVLIDHPDFDIKCDKLEIHLNEGATTGGASGGSTGGSFKRAIASGGMVEIRRVSPDGELQVALARRADYNGSTKDIILSGGPPSIQAGEKLVETNSHDSQIIMRGNGKYEVKGTGQGSGNRIHMVFPVENEGGGSTSIGIGEGLGSGIDQLR